MKELTLKEAKRLYWNTGFCEHAYTEPVIPYNSDVKITNCVVCGEEIGRVYVNKC